MEEKNFKIICVTNRRLCSEDFSCRLRKIAAAGPDAVILREKDLRRTEYLALAWQSQRICQEFGVPCVWHTYYNEETEFLHLPLPLFRAGNFAPARLARFRAVGVSCHSPAEAAAAAQLGCTYLTAGHIFDTDCKAGLPGRGLDFLRQTCGAVGLPVYAIGGINADNIGQIKKAGARGACLMSGFMTCAEPAAILAELRAAANDCE